MLERAPGRSTYMSREMTKAKQRKRRESPTMSRKLGKSSLKDLPLEVLEIVFAFLPEHVVCRFRVVCKSWNRLILQPEFAFLRTLTPRQASSVLISPKLMKRAPNTAWHVLDTEENRSYKLPDDDFNVTMTGRYKYTLASDGGLIYTMYSDALWSGSSRRPSRVHVVCNPVSKSFHQIPEPEFYFSYNRDIVVMSVDNATKAYKIITITTTLDPRFNSLYKAQIYLYDSSTSMWKKLCEAPIPIYEHQAYSSIFVNGVLYILYGIYMHPRLYSCDLETGAWRRIHVKFHAPSYPHNKFQLVGSLDRLFMVEYTGLARKCRKQWIALSILEIVVGKKKVVKVAGMEKFCKYPKRMLEELDEVMGEPVVAVGCANAIVISSLMGPRVKFDLLERQWYELTPYTPYNEHGSVFEGICTGLLDV